MIRCLKPKLSCTRLEMIWDRTIWFSSCSKLWTVCGNQTDLTSKWCATMLWLPVLTKASLKLLSMLLRFHPCTRMRTSWWVLGGSRALSITSCDSTKSWTNSAKPKTWKKWGVPLRSTTTSFWSLWRASVSPRTSWESEIDIRGITCCTIRQGPFSISILGTFWERVRKNWASPEIESRSFSQTSSTTSWNTSARWKFANEICSKFNSKIDSQ